MSKPLSGATTFLLGSGISIPSGYPTTAEITSHVLSKNWPETRNQRTKAALQMSPEYWAQANVTLRLLRLLRNHVDQHLALYGQVEASYEDIYFLGQQLLDSLEGEYENPGLLPWLMDLRHKLSTLEADTHSIYRLGETTKWHEREKLVPLVQGCLEHIQESVASLLTLPKRTRGLRLLTDFLSATRPSPLNIVTLNHDTLLNHYFAKKKVLDGFRPFSPGAQVFDPRQFESSDPFQVRLLKLHGSIDWFRYKSYTETDLAIKVFSGDCNRVRDEEGRDLRLPVSRLLLAGTTNKELAYGSGIFLELMFQFHQLLKQTQLLVVSGYGFGDKGINNRLWAWLDARSENRMIILHAHKDELERRAKPSLALNLKRHDGTKKILWASKWMCDTTVDDLLAVLRCNG